MEDRIYVSRIDTTAPEYTQAFALRDEILRKPLGMSLKNDDLSRDLTDVILIAQYQDVVIACLMLHHKDDANLQLRQMAVASNWQGKSVGRFIVREAELYAQEKGYKTMVLHARKVAVGFYKRLGYKITSREFMEVGIPHYIMEKELIS